MNVIQDKPTENEILEPAGENAKRRDQRLAERNVASDRVGELARYIAFAIVGGILFLFTIGTGPAGDLATAQRSILVGGGVASCLAIFMDYFQYFFKYLSSDRAFKNEKGEYYYEEEWVVWKLVMISFWAKQMFVILSVSLLVVALLRTVIS